MGREAIIGRILRLSALVKSVDETRALLIKEGIAFCTDKTIPLEDRWAVYVDCDFGDHDDYIPDPEISEYFRDYITDRSRGNIHIVEHLDEKLGNISYLSDMGMTLSEYKKNIEEHAELLEAIMKAWIKSFTIDW